MVADPSRLLPCELDDQLWLTDPASPYWNRLHDGGWQPQDPDDDPDPDRLTDRLCDPDNSTDDAWPLALADHTRWTGLPDRLPPAEPTA